ncbi:MAG: acyl-CoA dehydrogenase family protein, partial [Promethearchaeota archaeon]
MFDYLISEDAKSIKEEVRAFVRDEVPHNLIKKMDKEEISYPVEYLQKLGKRNLIGLRFPKEFG